MIRPVPMFPEACDPLSFDGQPPWMDPREIKALDVALHLLWPDIVVETGTGNGGATRLFARHCRRVVTIDPVVQNGLALPENVTMIVGAAPQALYSLDVAEFVAGRHWLFFHDSLHTRTQLVAEVRWAFEHGAAAAMWHDSGMQDERYPASESMARALDDLGAFCWPRRLQVLRESSTDQFTGLGIAFPLQRGGAM